MADNETTQSATPATLPAGVTFAFDELTGGVKVARSKTGFGVDGSYVDVSESNPLPVVATALGTLTGAVDETAPSTDTASSGLNGRLQRIAQRLSTIIGLLPTSLGAGGGLKVDGSGTALPVSGTVTANLAAGTNAIGKLAANSGVDIGDVDVTSLPALPAGTNRIGSVVSRLGQMRLSQQPTISAGSIYAIGDAVGGLLTFANAAAVSGGTITITAVVIIDEDQELAPLELVLFDRTFTATSDNALFDPSDADLANCIGVIKVSDYANFVDNSVATRECRLTAKLNGTDLFGQLVVRSTPTYTATDDITVIVQVAQD